MNQPNPVSLALVLAIDGPAGSGKSEAAMGLAKLLGYEHLDTGALYRATTLICIALGIDVTQSELVIAAIKANIGRITTVKSIVHLDGRPVGEEIRTSEVDVKVGDVSEIPEVRELITEIQRSCVNAVGLVAEGRDLTSVVFAGEKDAKTNALLKIYLTASPEVRARRRFEQKLKKGQSADYDDVLAKLIKRDQKDSTRTCCPLRLVETATKIDSDEMTLDQVIRLIQGIWESRLTIVNRHLAVA